MPRRTLSVSSIAVAVLLSPLVCLAQQEREEAASKPAASTQQTITATAERRARGILKELALTDQAKAEKVHDIIVGFYVKRIAWGPKDEEMKQLARRLRSSATEKDQAQAEEIDKQIAALREELAAMRAGLLARLGEVLTPEQVETVKDVMTYKKVPLLLKACTRRNTLTDRQRAVVLKLLTDAREEAMVAGSSEDKHGIFNRAVGKVNLYLDAQNKLAEVMGAIHADKLQQAEAGLTKLENGREWLKEAMSEELTGARKALWAAKAGLPPPQSQPTQPAVD